MANDPYDNKTHDNTTTLSAHFLNGILGATFQFPIESVNKVAVQVKVSAVHREEDFLLLVFIQRTNATESLDFKSFSDTTIVSDRILLPSLSLISGGGGGQIVLMS
jgi:hypothetical protein